MKHSRNSLILLFATLLTIQSYAYSSEGTNLTLDSSFDFLYKDPNLMIVETPKTCAELPDQTLIKLIKPNQDFIQKHFEKKKCDDLLSNSVPEDIRFTKS